MTVYEVLCLLNPNDTVNIVDSRDSSSLYSKFSYNGLVSKIPFRPDVFNHSVYQISSDNGFLYSLTNEVSQLALESSMFYVS